MSTYRFIGSPGGDWFDPANWSDGIVPMPGDVAQVFGTSTIETDGTIAGVTIDLSAQTVSFPFDPITPPPNLDATLIGTASAPVTLDVTADGGAAASSELSFGTFIGSIDVAAGQGLGIDGGTIDGDVTIHRGADLGVFPRVDQDLIEIPPTDLELDGTARVDGGNFDLYVEHFTGDGSVVLSDGGRIGFETVPPNAGTPTQTVGITFDATGGTLDASGFATGYQGTLSGFGVGDEVDLDEFGLNAPSPLRLAEADGTLTVTNVISGQGETFHFAGSLDPIDFQLVETGTGSGLALIYGPAAAFTGADGTDWFDPGNWTDGAVPDAGTTAKLYTFGSVDATAGLILSHRLDISGQATLIAGAIGDAQHPVEIDFSLFGGAYDSSTISFASLDGSLRAEAQTDPTLDTLAGGTTIDGSIQVEEYGYGSILTVGGAGPLVLNGDATGDGTLRVDVAAHGTGTLDVLNVAIAEAAPGEATLAVVVDGQLDVTRNPGGYAGTIESLGSLGEILAAYVEPSYASAPLGVSYADGTLTIVQPDATGPNATETFHFAGAHTLAEFDVEVERGDIVITERPCFAPGTMIGTESGECAVEYLRPGNRVRLVDGSLVPVVWTGHRRLQDGDVIRIRAGALGGGLPRRDLVVSDDHALFVDGVLVPAGLLADGVSILRERRREIVFHHVELERHAILLAEGAPAESYLDTGNRRQFGNCPIGYDPLEAATHEPCAEILFAGHRLARIRDRLPIPA